MKALIQEINRILKGRKARRVLTRFVSAAAAIVVFVTTYALVMPAITLEAEAQCGIEAHQHDDSCYEDVLICGWEEGEGHTHDASCYSTSRDLTCEIPEHKHDDTCYDEDGNLECEFKEHKHTDECYKETKELTCGLSETESHTHTDACYERQLTCGKEAHTHSAACYEESVDAIPVNPATGERSSKDSKTDTIVLENPDLTQDQTADAEAMPAASFEETITVNGGSLSTDSSSMDQISPKTNLTVHAEADEGTFPEGTTMTLSALTGSDLETVGQAVENAVDSTTRGFHAVDITFHDKDGNEIEPLKPIRVNITSDAIKQAAEDNSTAPVVVHIEGMSADGNTGSNNNNEDSITGSNSENGKETETGRTTDTSSTNTDTEPRAEVIETSQKSTEQTADHTPANGRAPEQTTDTISFESDAFSVYAIVYTVDFEYSVNGKTYQFSLPGGGFVSFTDLVEVLGMIRDTNTGEGGYDNRTETAENAEENPVNEATKENENSVDSGKTTELTLGDVEASAATKKFVANVSSVEFSSPELVWVGKAEAATTVGELKVENGLECEYSSDLTEEQIAEINDTEVESGDWALISVQPFTSEETMTVTMKNGQQFVVKVTDGQLHNYVLTDSGRMYKVTITYDETAQIPENAELRVRQITRDEKEYATLCQKGKAALLSENVNGEKDFTEDSGDEESLLFDIAIISDGKEVEPAPNAEVQVDITLEGGLAKTIITEAREENSAGKEILPDDTSNKEKETGLMINGVYTVGDAEAFCEPAIYVAHHMDDGTTEIIHGLQSEVNEKGEVSVSFSTDHFSAYQIDSVSNNMKLYVGDEIYIRGSATSSNNSVASVENRGNNYYVVKLKKSGTFNIWGNKYWYHDYQGDHYQNYNYQITVEDYLIQANHPDTIETVNHQESGIKLNLFDYDPDGVLNEAWNTSGYSASQNDPYKYYYNYGINNGKILKFWTGCPGYDTPYNNTWDVGKTSASPGIVSNTLSGGYPTVTKGNQTDNLSYLFAPSSDSTKTCYSNVEGLFKKNSDGYYVYDSYTNYAYLNGNTFEVYDRTFSYGSGSSKHKVGFFPFHPYNEDFEKTLTTISGHQQMNHHFGLTMEVDFVLPDDGVDPITGKDIIFSFNGDDDLWVYVDDNLKLDLGGIHQPVDGDINFTNWVKDPNNPISTGENNVHKLKVFYIERGGGDSNCKITFNTTRYKDIRFEKKGEENNLLNGAKFQLFKEDGTTPVTHVKRDAQGNLVKNNGVVQTENWIVEAGTIDNKDGQVVFKGVPVGTYVIKEVKSPEGYKLEGSPFEGKVYISDNNVVVDIKDKNGTPISEIINHPYTTDVTVKKTDGHTFLPGAKFQLKIKTEGGQYIVIPSVPDFTVESENGYKITGLRSGKYQLTEIDAPDGYIIVNNPIEFEIKPGSSGENLVIEYENTDYASLENKTFTVINTPGAALPNTGGPGTRLFTILGNILIAGAGLLLLRRRKNMI